jgi:hypothetical protein
VYLQQGSVWGSPGKRVRGFRVQVGSLQQELYGRPQVSLG